MTHTCPRCLLPLTRVGRAYAATSQDHTRHGVVPICHRCTGFAEQFSRRFAKTLHATIMRALDDPAKYGVRLYPEIGTAQLAVGMLGLPDLAERTLDAMGW